MKKKVTRRGKRAEFSHLQFFFVFVISLILFSLLFLLVFSFSSEKPRVAQLFSSLKSAGVPVGRAVIAGNQVESEETTLVGEGGSVSGSAIQPLHNPSTGIVPGFGLPIPLPPPQTGFSGFYDLPIPALDLYPAPTISSIVVNGNWEDSSSWDLGRVPQAGDVVLIKPGHTIILGSTTPDISAVNINGTLSFSRTTNSRLNVGYVYVRLGGKLDMGNVTNPILDPVTAEIHFLNVLIPGDTNEVGPGLTALGAVTAHGQPRQDTFVRTTTAPAQGATTIILEKDVQTGGANGIGWKTGDEVVVPASRWSLTINDGHETEVRKISAVSGNTITLNSSLSYPHPDGCTYDNPATCTFKPHVALLSRNVKITSDPAGTRGTISILDTSSQLDMRYVEVNGLGRPFNRAARPGRYAIHLHHLHFMGQNTAIVGSSVSNALSVGIRIHGTDFSLIKDNVILNTFGYGISAEDATENGNVIDHNIVLNIPGDGSRPTDLLGIKENGISIFLMNPLNIIKNNVGGGYAARSFIAMVMLYGSQRATIWNRDGTTRQVYIQNETIINMDNNENYGPTLFGDTEGLDVWHAFTHHSNISIIKNYKAWNTVSSRIFYPGYNVIIHNLTARNCHDGGFGVDDYDEANLVLRNSDIRGCDYGIIAVINSPDTNFYTNIFLANMTTGIILSVKRYNSIFATSLMPERDLIFRNITFSGNTQDIFGGQTGGDNRDYIHYDRIFFFDYNGVKGDNFEYFFPNITGNMPYPSSIPQCTTTRSKITGFTCPVNLTCSDNDGDGYGIGCYRGLDCNDNDPNVNPGMPEICGNNTIDDNCDGVAGVDGDGDGYGASCSLGADCNDAVTAINPGAAESIGSDNNCDGRVKATPSACGGVDDARRVLFLSFDNTLNDGSGNGNQGSCYSSCPSYVAGVSGSAIHFTQNYPYEAITVTRNPSLDLQEFSVELWAYPRSDGNIFTRMGTWPPYNIGFSISIDNGRIKIIDNNRDYIGSLISLNRWHHIVATRTAQGKINLYLDGESTLSFVDKMPLMISGDISIGSNKILPAEPYLGSVFQGDIDNLALYNKVLSFGEVLSHNNSGICSVPTCTDNDGDGYGRGCSLGEDCNDAPGVGASINPGVSEVCGDSVDNNCNLQTDECCNGQKAGACWNEMPARSIVLLNSPIVVYNKQNLYFLNQFSDQDGNGFADYPPVLAPVWKQIDLESAVPKEATGVLVRAVKYNLDDNDWAGVSPRIALKSLGENPRSRVDLFYIGHNMSSTDYTTYIPFSAGKKGFEYEGEHFWRDFPISLRFEVIGYTLANSTTKSYTQVFNPPVRAFQAAGLGDTMEWVEVDLSSYLPADAKAVIMQVQSWGNDTRMGMVEIRSKNIPTSNMSLGFHAVPKSPARFFLLGAEKKVEYRIMGSDTNAGLLNFDLLGYLTDSTTSGLTTNFFNDPVEVYENYEFNNTPWKNVDISSWVPSNTQAVYVAVEYKTGGGGSISSIKLSAPSQTANTRIELWDHRDAEDIYLVPVENGIFSFTTVNSSNRPVANSHMRLSLKGYLTGTGAAPNCTDADGDGYNNTSGFCGLLDCNDNPGGAGIHPNQAEPLTCDNVDQNCNGMGDEPYTTYYNDSDGDTYGNLTIRACTQPPTAVFVGGDCNDNNGAVNPGRSEVCNGIDDNCANGIDEGLLVVLYRDADNDGFGNNSQSSQVCAGAAGYVSNNNDCNDNNPGVNATITCMNYGTCVSAPACVASCSATPTEICEDWRDANCNPADELCAAPPLLNVRSPSNRTYTNQPLPVNFTSVNASSCWYVDPFGGIQMFPACNLNTTLFYGRGNKIFTLVVNNSKGIVQANFNVTLNITNKFIIRYNEFYKKGQTTDLDVLNDTELENVALVLHLPGLGKIEFLDLVNLTKDADVVTNVTDLDAGVNISLNRIEVNPVLLSALNTRARLSLELQGLNLNDPRILRDGVVCGAPACVEESYNATTQTFVFNVSGFSVYTVEETPIIIVEPPITPGGGGGGGGGGSSTPFINGTKNVTQNGTKAVPVENKTQEEAEIPSGEGEEEQPQAIENVIKNGWKIILAIVVLLIALGVIVWFVWWHQRQEIKQVAEEFREQFEAR